MKKIYLPAFLAVAMLLAVPLSGYAGETRFYFGVRIGAGHPPVWSAHPRVWASHPPWGAHRFYWRGPIVVKTYPYYVTPPVVIQLQPPVYVYPEPPRENYWYYCPNPQGYYPYVQSCPGGWMKVVPQPAPPTTAPGQ